MKIKEKTMKKIYLFALALIFISTLSFGSSITTNNAKDEYSDESDIIVEHLLDTESSWNKSTLPAYIVGQPEIVIEKVIFQPGAQSLIHLHPVISAGVLLSGSLTITTDTNQVLHLQAGQAFAEVVNTWHYGKNEGKVPAELIFFHASTDGVPITILK
ncbi:MAG: Cupin 2 conserved barrel domain protein [Burkholderiales bacterium]|jgi:quercetin dioxygenase-like cupin family protein|nr:Cupin 2 conserved barrel domain protein [Burkholderiales bacterium]